MTATLRALDTPSSEATLFIPTPLHSASEALAEKLFARVVRPGVDGWSRERCLLDCDAILSRIGVFTAEDIASAPRLKIIARNGTGYDNIHVGACIQHGIVVTNMPGGNAAEVAELTIALALALLRRVVELNNRIRAGERLPSIQVLAPGLLGKTVGLIGMGSIAYHAAKLFRAFGCRIVVYSPTSPSDRWTTPTEGYEEVIAHTRANTLEELLETSDVVSLHCPLTPHTKNLISARELALMRPGAVLINTSRGGMVDQDALAEALKEGTIGGAGLDVMTTEPAYGENIGSLRGLDNVIILPHVGGNTEDSAERGCTAAIRIVADYLDGRGVRNRVA